MDQRAKGVFGWWRWVAVVAFLGASCGVGDYGRLSPTLTDASGTPAGIGPGADGAASGDSVTGSPYGSASGSDDVVLIGAGDIADCDSPGDEITAALVDSVLRTAGMPTWVYTLGDNAYGRGTYGDFSRCYHPSWGTFRDYTRPVPGNHDYKNGQLLGILPLFGNADPYFEYFSAFPEQAGGPEHSSYTYRHGAWDVYALDTAGDLPLSRGEPAWQWLEAQLSRPDRTECVLVYNHFPRFTIGKHRDNDALRDGWDLLERHGVDLLLAGHDHNYQRFAPQSSDGAPDPTGVRQFVVGTGGAELRSDSVTTAGQLERWTADHFGVLKLVLRPQGYEWEYITDDGVWDRGSSECQNAR